MPTGPSVLGLMSTPVRAYAVQRANVKADNRKKERSAKSPITRQSNDEQRHIQITDAMYANTLHRPHSDTAVRKELIHTLLYTYT